MGKTKRSVITPFCVVYRLMPGKARKMIRSFDYWWYPSLRMTNNTPCHPWSITTNVMSRHPERNEVKSKDLKKSNMCSQYIVGDAEPIL